MAHAWRKWSGLILTFVWMTARLVLPLQAQCPHHASADASHGSNAHLSLTIAAPDHAHHVGHAAVTNSPASNAPHESAPIPCECAAHCCAAASVMVGTPSVSVVPLPPLLERTVHALALDVLAPRKHAPHWQPPATAPPLDSVVS